MPVLVNPAVSTKVCTCAAPGAVHEPGEPAVNVAWVRSAMNIWSANSTLATAISVEQSTAAPSNSAPEITLARSANWKTCAVPVEKLTIL
jgi:hypothetical protein